MMTPFKDRCEAGRQLAQRLIKYRFGESKDAVLVLGLARGGVPVAAEVARALTAPLEVLVVRKIGVPAQPELAMGAIASGGVIVRNQEVIRQLNIDERAFDAVVAREARELRRREEAYRGRRRQMRFAGKVCIIVDDGIATGASMQAAVLAVRKHSPLRVVIATPVAAASIPSMFAALADEFVSVLLPDDFSSVGLWYEDFSQTTDDEVRSLLLAAAAPLLRAPLTWSDRSGAPPYRLT